VLYQEPVRSLLLWIAARDGFDPYWTEQILEETRRNLLAARAVSPEQWVRLRSALLAAFPGAMLDQAAADAIEQQMPNHPKDRHVLAAAVAADIDLVITDDLKHFKQTDIEQVGVRALTADQFLYELLDAVPSIVLEAIESHVARMRNPRQWTIPELLGRLAGMGSADALAPRFVKTAATRFDIKAATPPARTSHLHDE
jgi:predicted nucleic acid-binding protein